MKYDEDKFDDLDLGVFDTEELEEELERRKHPYYSLDLVDRERLDGIIAVFYTANWAERENIYKKIVG